MNCILYPLSCKQTIEELSKELSRFYDYGWLAKVKNRVYRQRNKLLYRLLDFTGAYVFLYRFRCFFTDLGGVVLVSLTAAHDTLLCPPLA